MYLRPPSDLMRSGLPSLSPPEHLAHPVESCILYCTSRRVLLCVICYGFVCLLSAPLFCIRLICLLLAESCSQLVYLIHNSSLTISRSSLHFSTLNLTFSTRPSYPVSAIPTLQTSSHHRASLDLGFPRPLAFSTHLLPRTTSVDLQQPQITSVEASTLLVLLNPTALRPFSRCIRSLLPIHAPSVTRSSYL